MRAATARCMRSASQEKRSSGQNRLGEETDGSGSGRQRGQAVSGRLGAARPAVSALLAALSPAVLELLVHAEAAHALLDCGSQRRQQRRRGQEGPLGLQLDGQAEAGEAQAAGQRRRSGTAAVTAPVTSAVLPRVRHVSLQQSRHEQRRRRSSRQAQRREGRQPGTAGDGRRHQAKSGTGPVSSEVRPASSARLLGVADRGLLRSARCSSSQAALRASHTGRPTSTPRSRSLPVAPPPVAASPSLSPPPPPPPALGSAPSSRSSSRL